MRPIRVYLLILVLGAMLPGALLTGVLVWRAFVNHRAVSERRLLDSARVDAAALDREFVSTMSVLQTLATSPALDRGDFEAFYQEGRRAQSTQPGWYTLALLAPDGRQLLSTRQPMGVTLPQIPERASLERLTATKQPVVGTVVRPPTGGSEHLLPIRVPVVRDGQLKYALSAIVNVESLARLIPQNPDEWTRTIVDPDGTIAVRTRGARSYVGLPVRDDFRDLIRRAPETFARTTTRDGEQVYAASSRSKFGWTAVVAVSPSTLDAPLNASINGVLAGGTVLMLCGLAAVLVISRRLSGDLAAATTAAEAVAEGRPVPRGDAHVVETHRLQRALATAATLLEKRAHERDEEVRRADTARTEAENANRTKDQFLAVLGHELRNPLAPALTALELMKARDAAVFKRERQVLERQVAHMARLVNDLLDVSRLARGKVQLHRRRFELREAVDRAVDMARPLLTQQGHTLDVDVPDRGLALDADLDRIVQVLSNLLTNAAKYTPPGSHVALTASASIDRVVITCEDNGPGVPKDLVARLFEMFSQGPRALDRREGGLGLGLSLARTFTELHSGTIRVEERKPEVWSRFVVTLPLATAEAAVPAAPSADLPGPLVARRVLLVDDNADACEMLRSTLSDAGHVLAVAGSGLEALAVAAEFHPEVGVLDIGLPGMDGYELARRLRASHPGIRLIALTGYGQTADVDAAVAAGFDAHCAKPVTTLALLELIAARTSSGSASDVSGVTHL